MSDTITKRPKRKDWEGSCVEYADALENYTSFLEKKNKIIKIYNQAETRKIFEDLLISSEEHIKTGGIRFYGIHFEKIKTIFKKYGCEFVQPF